MSVAAWFQRQLAVDASVVGVTLFAYGNGSTWPSFQIDPIEPQLETPIKTCPDRRLVADSGLAALYKIVHGFGFI